MSNSAAGNGCISRKTGEGSLKIGKIPRVKIKEYNTWRTRNRNFNVPDVQLFCLFELKFENPEMTLYKIAKEFGLFRDLKKRVKKVFHIGYYKGVKPVARQFFALRAAPHRNNVLLNDCVEFAKEFCVAMLSYCKNHRELEPDVNS